MKFKELQGWLEDHNAFFANQRSPTPASTRRDFEVVSPTHLDLSSIAHFHDDYPSSQIAHQEGGGNVSLDLSLMDTSLSISELYLQTHTPTPGGGGGGNLITLCYRVMVNKLR